MKLVIKCVEIIRRVFIFGNLRLDNTAGTLNDVISQIVENTPGVVPLEKIAPNAIIVYGKLIPVERKCF